MPVRTIETMKQHIDETLSAERLTAYLSVFIGALALLLTSVGLYGILAYAVSRRTGEIGIRMALGAQRSSVVWLVIWQVMAHIALGAAIGIAAVLMSSHLVKKLLYDVSPNDPATIAAAAGALILVGVIAAAIPARRATQLDPMQALREE
jgi:ABC-type antimicrobial peptide transport system permease subunit